MLRILATLDLEERYADKIRSCFPGIEVRKSADEETLLTAVQDADILLAGKFNRELFSNAKKLGWIHTHYAGVERFLFPEFVASEVLLTSSRGIHGTCASDHVMAFILAFNRGLNLFMRFQSERKWMHKEAMVFPLDELEGKTIGIIGLGSIGKETARKARAFGMHVIGLSRTRPEKFGYLDEFMTPANLSRLLQKSDFVVLCLPLTHETEGMIGEEQLSQMKPEAILINVSRGRLIRENALVKALKEGRIAGAGLDVVETEPLPTDSELWSLQNVVITPHVAWQTPHEWTRVIDIFCENLRRYSSGRPLINQVDKKSNY
jgi:D-2-hydroxyacid dehydrogenase (NADP+)